MVTSAAVGELAEVSVIDRLENRILPVHRHQGRYYVAGNPGREYQETRHNVGFMVVDAVRLGRRACARPGVGERTLRGGADDGGELPRKGPERRQAERHGKRVDEQPRRRPQHRRGAGGPAGWHRLPPALRPACWRSAFLFR